VGDAHLPILDLLPPQSVVSTLLGVVTAWYREPAVARRAGPTIRALAGSFPTSLLGDSTVLVGGSGVDAGRLQASVAEEVGDDDQVGAAA
jgi:hypothetical protein